MTPEELRRLAIEEALRRHPELVNASGADELARLNAIASELEPEIQVKYELEEIRRREFAEQAASQQRVAKEAKEAERRKKAEEERLRREEQERQRQEQLRKEAEQRKKEKEEKHRKDQERIAAMPPLRRFIRRNWIAVSAAALVFIVAPLVAASWFGFQSFERNRLLSSCDWNNLAAVTEETPNWADEWINCSDQEVRIKVVGAAPDSFWTEERYQQIAKDESADVVIAMLLERRWNVPDSVFDDLALSSSPAVREAVLSRRTLPESTQKIIATHPDENMQLALMDRSGVRESALLLLAESEKESVVAALAERPQLPDSVLLSLVSQGKQGVMRGLLERDDLSGSVIEAMYKVAEGDLRDSVRNLTVERVFVLSDNFLKELIATEDEEFLILLASNPSLPPAAQKEIYTTSSEKVVEALSENPRLESGIFPACAVGGPCRIGDEGPGGGIVFFDAGARQSWGQYLEAAAPRSGALGDPLVVWCRTGAPGYRSPLNTKSELGTGKDNTQVVARSCGGGTAAARAASFQGGGKSDWYLPAIDELKEMFNQKSLLQLDVEWYWSSTSTYKPDSRFLSSDSSNKVAVLNVGKLTAFSWSRQPGYVSPESRVSRFVENAFRPIRAF